MKACLLSNELSPVDWPTTLSMVLLIASLVGFAVFVLRWPTEPHSDSTPRWEPDEEPADDVETQEEST